MAVGDYPFPKMHAVKGVKLTAVCAGIKKINRRDVVLFELAEGSNVAGVFTKNALRPLLCAENTYCILLYVT
jgi:glutamate N-acetyltransferase / amino-acid N-acetyltransferase